MHFIVNYTFLLLFFFLGGGGGGGGGEGGEMTAMVCDMEL